MRSVNAGDQRTPGTANLAIIGVLIAITATNAIAVSLIVPSLPSIRSEFATDLAAVQLILSGYLVATAISQLVIGPLTDRFGRRPVLLTGLLVFAVSGAVAAVAGAMEALVLARLVQGASSSVGVVVGRAVIRDLYDRDAAASVLGYVTMGLAVVPMIGPFIGGTIDDAFGWRAVFLFIAAMAVIVLAGSWIILPETRTTVVVHTARSLLAEMGALLRIPAFWAYAATMSLLSGTYFSFLAGAPFVATELIGLTATELGAFLLFVAAGYFVGNYLAGRFSQRLGVHLMLNLGNTIVCASIGLMIALFAAGWLNAWTLFLPMTFLGLGNGISLPGAIAGSISLRPDLAGTASGLGGAMQFGTGAASAVIAGAALAAWPSALAVTAVMAGFAVVGTATGVWSRWARG